MSKKIMIVDDSISIRKVVAMVLGRAGYTVIESKDGVDGLQKLNEVEVDLIICDVNMPNMDGLAFLKNLREQSGGELIPV
ncbi:MAG: response regulator, partial [Leptospirales bacterium]